MSSEELTLFQCLKDDNILENCWLSEDETIALIGFAATWRSPLKIARGLGLSKDRFKRFMKEFNDNNSVIRNIFDIARLKSEGDIMANAILRAKESVAGEKAYREILEQEKISDLRDALIPKIEDPAIDGKPVKQSNERNISYFRELQEFFEKGAPDGQIPEYLKAYWTKLNIAVDLLSSFHKRAKGTKYIMNILREKFSCTESYAYNIIREAQHFFSVQEDKTILLKSLYEDLDKTKCIAWEKGDDKVFIDAVKIQLEIVKTMRDTKDIPPEIFEQRVIITSHDPREFGIEPIPKNELLSRIKKFKLHQSEKQKLLKELNINESENSSQENISE